MNESVEDGPKEEERSGFSHAIVVSDDEDDKASMTERQKETMVGEKDPENILFGTNKEFEPKIDKMPIEQHMEETLPEEEGRKTIFHGVMMTPAQWKFMRIILAIMGVVLVLCLILEILHYIQIKKNSDNITDYQERLTSTETLLQSTKEELNTAMSSSKSTLETEMLSTKLSLDEYMKSTKTTLTTDMETMETEIETYNTQIENDLKVENDKFADQTETVSALNLSVKENAEMLADILGEIYFISKLRPEGGFGKVSLEWIVNTGIKEGSSCKLSGSALAEEDIELKGRKIVSDLTMGVVYSYKIVCESPTGREFLNELFLTVPHLVTTCGELKAIGDSESSLGGYHGLSGNIDCVGVTFPPIGTTSTPFKGEIDGFGYAISNLKVDNSTNNQGFIGVSQGGKVGNLIFKDINIGETAGGGFANVGGVVGYSLEVVLENVHVRGGTITGGDGVGGLIGASQLFDAGPPASGSKPSSLLRSSVDVQIIGDNKVGGLIGISYQMKVEESFSKGGITQSSGDIYAGGIIGFSDSPTFMLNCYSEVEFKGAGTKIGGLIGKLNYASDENSYYAGIIGPNIDVAGTVFESDKVQEGKNLYWDTEVSGVSVAQNGARMGKGFTTADMKNMVTFIGYDFTTIWYMDDTDYPRFQWEKKLVIP